jgi:hypothetical protein
MIMKLGKPTYAKESQVYVCECRDVSAFRVESAIEGGKWSVPLDGHLAKTREQMISLLLVETTGWFSKPLTKEWLHSRLRYTIPTGDIPSDFEGMCAWTLDKLLISKESFVCEFVLAEKVATALPLIDLHEDEVVDSPGSGTSGSSPTREGKKEIVLRARRRAAMALLKAERLMQAYADEFGEDTDWEDDEDEA